MIFILKLMLLIITLLFITFSMFTQPLSIGLILVLQTLLMASILYILIKISWFSFILIIVIVGALLVTFIYIAVLIPNEPHARRSFWSIPIIVPAICYAILINPVVKIPYLNPQLPQTIFFLRSIPFTLLLTLLLLISLILVVYNTRTTKAPMRSYL